MNVLIRAEDNAAIASIRLSGEITPSSRHDRRVPRFVVWPRLIRFEFTRHASLAGSTRFPYIILFSLSAKEKRWIWKQSVHVLSLRGCQLTWLWIMWPTETAHPCSKTLPRKKMGHSNSKPGMSGERCWPCCMLVSYLDFAFTIHKPPNIERCFQLDFDHMAWIKLWLYLMRRIQTYNGIKGMLYVHVFDAINAPIYIFPFCIC